jgi:hypothetical protein
MPTVQCSRCGADCEKSNGHINRARKVGAQLYCDKACAGRGRRVERTVEQKKAKKRDYDAQYRAKKEYGEFWQCFLVVASIDKEVSERATKMEIAVANGTLNKAQTRKRNYERAYSNQP